SLQTRGVRVGGVSYSVYVLAPGEEDVSKLVKLSLPAIEVAEVVLRELYDGTAATYVNEEFGTEWHELDAATCRQRIPSAVRSARPADSASSQAWTETIYREFGELAEALEEVERRTGLRP